MKMLQSDWWMGWVRETDVLVESGQKTESVEDVRQEPYPKVHSGNGRTEVGVERAEAVEVDKKHLKSVRDGWKRRKERA